MIRLLYAWWLARKFGVRGCGTTFFYAHLRSMETSVREGKRTYAGMKRTSEQIAALEEVDR